MSFEPMQDEIANDEGNPIKIWLADGADPAKLLAIYGIGDTVSSGRGLLLLGEDTSGNAASLKFDASGNLLVTGGGGGQQYADGTSDTGAQLGTIALGTDGSNFRYLATDADGQLQVDVLTLPAIAQLPSVLSGDRLKVESQQASGATQNVVITDPTTSSQQAAVDTSGRLLVSTQAPVPTSSTPISYSVVGNVNGNSTSNTYFALSTTLGTTIQKFAAGGEGVKKGGGHKVELYEDPNGNASILNLIAILYIPDSGGSASQDLNVEYAANGTRRILIRRTRMAGSSGEIYGAFSGFEV